MGKYFKFRREELPAVAGLIRQSYLRDKIEFEQFSPDFNQEFDQQLESRIGIVSELVNPLTLTAELKKVTERMYVNMDKVRSILELVQAYAQRANKDLTLDHTAFGCKEARRDARRRNAEGMGKWVTMVLQNIGNNKDALKARGYKEEMGTEIQELNQTIQKDNLLQVQKQKEREELVANNLSEFDGLWKMLHDICATGSLIFKNKNEVRMKEYMFSHLIKKVRNASKPKEEKKKRNVAPPQEQPEQVAPQQPQAETHTEPQPELQNQD